MRLVFGISLILLSDSELVNVHSEFPGLLRFYNDLVSILWKSSVSFSFFSNLLFGFLLYNQPFTVFLYFFKFKLFQIWLLYPLFVCLFLPFPLFSLFFFVLCFSSTFFGFWLPLPSSLFLTIFSHRFCHLSPVGWK